MLALPLPVPFATVGDAAAAVALRRWRVLRIAWRAFRVVLCVSSVCGACVLCLRLRAGQFVGGGGRGVVVRLFRDGTAASECSPRALIVALSIVCTWRAHGVHIVDTRMEHAWSAYS